jgi:hypothetical protein
MPGQVTVGGFLSGTPLGQVNVGPFSLTMNGANNLQMLPITFVSGFNSITVPSWATGMILIPNTSNAVGWTLKGVTGDTGVPLSLTNPTGPIEFPASPPATLGITAAANFTTITEIVFF